MSLASRLKERREELGLTQVQLAKLIGVTKGAVGNYETGISSMKAEILYKVCKVLKCDPNYLFQDEMEIQEEERFSFSELSHIKKYRTLDEHGKEIVKSVLDIEVSRIKAEQQEEPDEPQLVDIMHFLTPASAGTGMIVYEVGEFENLQVLSNAYTRQADYCVTVRGNSMEPRFHDGDLVMVKEQDDIEFGEIGVFVVDGNSYIKQKGDDRLISLNKSVPDVYINSYHSFDCQGRVIGVLDPDWIIK